MKQSTSFVARRGAGAVLLSALLLVFMAGNAVAKSTNEDYVQRETGPNVETLQPKSVDGILVFEAPDGSMRWWFDSRIYVDQAFYIEDKNDLSDGAELRRGRFAVKTQIWDDWYAELDMDFSDEHVEVKDAYLRFDNIFNRTGYIRMGNFRQPFGLEENTTSRYLMFLERSLGTDGFVPGRLFGVEVCKFNPHYRIAASLCEQDIEDFDSSDDETNGAAVRGTVTPINKAGQVIHLGASYYQHLSNLGSGKIQIDHRPETHVTRDKYYDTGRMNNANMRRQFGFETGVVWNRIFVQGEYMMTTILRDEDYDNYNFSGGYIFASFFLTPDTHPYAYDSAEFTRVIPSRKSGALEVAVRYSTLDLNDKDVYGGGATGLTGALNWYANPNIRFMFDYTMVDNDDYADANGGLVGNDDFSVVQFRMLVAF